MTIARSARIVAGTAAVAVAAGLASLLSEGAGRVVFGAVAALAVASLAAMVSRPKEFFVDAENASSRPRETIRRPVETSPLPITRFERVAFAFFFALAVVLLPLVAGGSLREALPLLGISAYSLIAGRLGLRGGYSHRDRLLFLLGEVVGAAILLGLVLQPIVS